MNPVHVLGEYNWVEIQREDPVVDSLTEAMAQSQRNIKAITKTQETSGRIALPYTVSQSIVST